MPYVRIDKLKTAKPFSDLFPKDPHLVTAIAENINENGFCPSRPLDVWHGPNIVVDGNTRLESARLARLDEVPVEFHEFADEDEAIRFAISSQRDRRNMTAADLLRCVEALDAKKKSGERSDLATGDTRSGKSSDTTAELLGISGRTVERARVILDHAPEDVKHAVLAGQQSIRGAYDETQARRKHESEAADLVNGFMDGLGGDLVMETPTEAKPKPRAVFNRTNENVEWALWTWNPVTGCKHDCDYCYARDIANRFYPQKFEPTFLPDRLTAPHNTPAPKIELLNMEFDPRACKGGIGEKNVFVCSMADLFGKWVPDDWINAVLDECRKAPQWNFLFLSKFPQRFPEIDWPANAWVGTTVDRQYRVKIAEKAFRDTNARVKWLSVEPMMERLQFESLDMFDWVVMGGASASSKTAAFLPPYDWHHELYTKSREANCKVYMKTNLGVLNRVREYPEG